MRARSTLEVVLAGFVFGVVHHATPIRGIGWTPALATLSDTSRRAIGDATGAASCATAPAAPRPTMVQLPCRDIILVTIFSFYLGGAESQRNTTNAHVVVFRGVPNNAWLAVVSEFSHDLACAANTCGGPGLHRTACDFLGGSLLSGALLGKRAGILGLCPITPHRSLLFAEEGNVARLLVAE